MYPTAKHSTILMNLTKKFRLILLIKDINLQPYLKLWCKCWFLYSIYYSLRVIELCFD